METDKKYEEKIIDKKIKLIDAGYRAVDELISVAADKILKVSSKDDDEVRSLAADRLKNAAAAKKIAVLDALEILNTIGDIERDVQAYLSGENDEQNLDNFAERNAG